MLPELRPTFQPVDVDRPETWPADVRRVIDEHMAGSERSGRERDEAEAAISVALAGHKVLGYHCTRLFPHEAEAIGTQGLRALSEGLVRDKINAAIATGELASGARVHAERENVYAIDNADGREGQVCLVLGRGIFDDDPGAVFPLLAVWGGEAIRGGPSTSDVLARCGTPTIVVAQLDLSGECWSSWPGLPEVLAATLEGGHARSDLHWRRDVAGDDVVGIGVRPASSASRREPAPRSDLGAIGGEGRCWSCRCPPAESPPIPSNPRPYRAFQALVPEEPLEIGRDPEASQNARTPAGAGVLPEWS